MRFMSISHCVSHFVLANIAHLAEELQSGINSVAYSATPSVGVWHPDIGVAKWQHYVLGTHIATLVYHFSNTVCGSLATLVVAHMQHFCCLCATLSVAYMQHILLPIGNIND